jgi:hypothetical protein
MIYEISDSFGATSRFKFIVDIIDESDNGNDYFNSTSANDLNTKKQKKGNFTVNISI